MRSLKLPLGVGRRVTLSLRGIIYRSIASLNSLAVYFCCLFFSQRCSGTSVSKRPRCTIIEISTAFCSGQQYLRVHFSPLSCSPLVNNITYITRLFPHPPYYLVINKPHCTYFPPPLIRFRFTLNYHAQGRLQEADS